MGTGPSRAASGNASVKEIFWLRGAGHTEFMDDDDPTFKRLVEAISSFLQRRVLDESP